MKEGKLLEIKWDWPDCGSLLHFLSCRTESSKKAPLFANFMQSFLLTHHVVVLGRSEFRDILKH